MMAPGTVHIETTGDPAMAAMLRTVARSVAADTNLGLDRVEDVALATSEAFALITSGDPQERVIAEITPSHEAVTVSVVNPSEPEVETERRDILGARVIHTLSDSSQIHPGQSVEFIVGTV